jgi:hypothetical protein
MKNPYVISSWVLVLFLSIILFQFLHECGHGLGSLMDGDHVSTGFNKVGDVEKKPDDRDFRSKRVVHGRFNFGDWLAPTLNWITALLFTGLLHRQKIADIRAMLYGAIALSSALIRFISMFLFFMNAILGKFSLEDEASLGLRATSSLKFPMPLANFNIIAKSEPGIFLSMPSLYIWPSLSFLISVICLALAYWKLSYIFRPKLRSFLVLLTFLFAPVFIWPLTFFITNKLDSLLRINW